jgi:hypothetical protein
MRPTVCVDLDGVLASYSGWKGVQHIGEPLPGAVEFTRRLVEFARVVIYTTRCTEDMEGRDGLKAAELRQLVQDWLNRNNFAYDEVWTGQGKPIYSCVVDDRAVCCRPMESEQAFEKAVDKARWLCGVTAGMDKAAST